MDLLQHCRHWLLPPHAPLVSGTVTAPSPAHSLVHCSPLSCCCPGRSILCTSCNRTLAAEENGEDSHTSHGLTTSVTIYLQRDMGLREGGGRGGGEESRKKRGRAKGGSLLLLTLIMQTHIHSIYTSIHTYTLTPPSTLPSTCPSVWTWCVLET